MGVAVVAAARSTAGMVDMEGNQGEVVWSAVREAAIWSVVLQPAAPVVADVLCLVPAQRPGTEVAECHPGVGVVQDTQPAAVLVAERDIEVDGLDMVDVVVDIAGGNLKVWAGEAAEVAAAAGLSRVGGLPGVTAQAPFSGLEMDTEAVGVAASVAEVYGSACHCAAPAMGGQTSYPQEAEAWDEEKTATVR